LSDALRDDVLGDVKIRLLISMAAFVLVGLASASVASAGTYTVHACKAPGGGKAVIPWTYERSYPSGYKTGDACPGGYMWMDLASNVEHAANDNLRANFVAPAGTEITAYSLRRSVQLSSPYHYDFHEIRADGSVTILETCFADAGCNGLGDFRAASAPGNQVTGSQRSGVTGLSFSVYCRNGVSGPPCPPSAPAANFQLHSADVTLTDSTPPTLLLPPTGSLLNSGTPLAGKQQVFVWAADQGGGVRDVLFEVDGKVIDGATIDDNDGRCREPFSVAQPCKLEARGTVSFDTSRLADGMHQLRLLVTDATGTNSAVWGPVTIETDNGTCDPAPASNALKVRTTFAAKSRARTRSIRYAQQPRVRGQVTRPDGTPARGVPICVADREDAPDAPLRRIRTLTTDDGGQFGYTLRRGPSRRVYFVARVDGGAASDSLAVRVRADAQLSASRRNLRNGQLLTLSGRLSGRPVPRRGVLVEMQVRKAKGWQTFGTTRATRSGRYRYRYRFTSTTGALRYRFRARVPSQATYPYTSGSSRPVSVVVRG
jgi:hypothetical protein